MERRWKTGCSFTLVELLIGLAIICTAVGAAYKFAKEQDWIKW